MYWKLLLMYVVYNMVFRFFFYGFRGMCYIEKAIIQGWGRRIRNGLIIHIM